MILLGAAIDQWIRMRLTTCHPGFESQAHHLRIYHFKSNVCYICRCIAKRTKNKEKETGFGPNFRNFMAIIALSNDDDNDDDNDDHDDRIGNEKRKSGRRKI